MIGEATLWFAVGALGMGLGTAVFLNGLARADSEVQKYYAVLAAISGIATVAYVLMALNVGAVSVDGRTVFVPRYIDWLLTTPLLLTYLWMLVSSERGLLARIVAVNVVVIVAGFGASLLSGTARFGLFAVGGLAYVGLAYLLVGPLTEQASGRATESLFRGLRNLTVILWSVYPIIWILGPTGLGELTMLTNVLLVTYLDLITKVGFGLIALNAGAELRKQLQRSRSTAAAGS
ncbi:bacteriorhodopsin [Halovenus sp. WSH3]|uniref:Bacteriorhodopsin n=1 Tax=Halovenus carboxidivorans TaxID=2692199 RepID=A0A6B0T5F9_9EURY|nr:bacteriorhodopsin [Halovenus carboxidivorans]MXR52187.1 bacteriorhodopsin [Halovenus carboxidivorans]